MGLGLVAFWAAAAAAPVPEALCAPGERVYFGCGLKGGKRVAVCGSADPASPGARVAYRFGRPGALELERWLLGPGAAPGAWGATDTHAASQSFVVGFDVGTTRTLVFDQDTMGSAGQNGAGVLVELERGTPAARTVSIACVGVRALDLEPLLPRLSPRP